MAAEEDGHILRQIWHSYLPVSVRLAPNEVTSLQEPDPYYLMVSRFSYFPLVLDKVLKHLQRVTQHEHKLDDLWLESDGIALKWHLPIGVLHDLVSPALPWALTLHLTDFPSEELLRCGSRAAIESQLMSGLKEADALKHRSTVMSQMQKKEHNQLWLGLQNDKFDQFWAVNRQLMADEFRFVPFRLHFPDMRTTAQKLIKPRQEDGLSPTTLRHLQSAMGVQRFRMVVHGVEPPLDTPLQWLSRHMSHADNFVHVALRETNSDCE